MKIGDLVRLHQFPDRDYGVIIKIAPPSAQVYWCVEGKIKSMWKIHLEVVSEG